MSPFPLLGNEARVGTYVHRFLSRQFESQGPYHYGNREVRTVVRSITGGGLVPPRVTPFRDRPDAVAVDVTPAAMTGSVYEIKHADISVTGRPSSFFNAALTAQAEAIDYISQLRSLLPSITWGLGTTWEANPASGGIKDWGPINAIDPRIGGLTDPGDHLVTFTSYGLVPGAVLWDSVSNNGEGVPLNVLVQYLQNFLVAGVLSAVVAEYSGIYVAGAAADIAVGEASAALISVI